ncbi:aspartate--tRNA ligase [Fusibacter paucivorans]|uniref:Multifunctional fusion protein n=1 Tax=Fusibacter paucivorans TaxID=76009 RepID=A0ABS5PNW2_9FIRM|nr:aspartate--tRNA ligase [Fusibacter paucivorans]MBS7525737.1 aspartate--tRNA ligase [Fusibacter paucivorans]
MLTLKRTTYGGRLRESHIGETVILNGWVQKRRDLGGVIFIDLRDKTGIVQVVFDIAHLSAADFEVAEHLRNESVIAVKGRVERRDEETINPNLETGTIDIRANQLSLLSESKNPPFIIEEAQSVREELRLKYRYLDLRRPELRKNLEMRQSVMEVVRRFMKSEEFLEIETPILTKSTPEGARDYLVPSRMEKGKFYALPQSPQIYKQLLMVGGIDRYYQIAKCFRDEDLRADRQPEFTQVDLEMSFVEQEDVIQLLETLFVKIFKETIGVTLPTPFRRMTYHEAMECYGFDKPDLRFDMPMVDLTDLMSVCSFDVFRNIVDRGGIVKGLTVPGGDSLTRTQIEELTRRAIAYGGKGMAWIAIGPDGTLKSVLTKYFSEDDMSQIIARLSAKPGDLMIFSADKADKARTILGSLRLDLGDMLGLRRKEDYAFVVVTDFPQFEWSEEEERFVAMHHPFTMPQEEDIPLLESDPAAVRAKSYDFVLNGIELGSGSIRIHREDVQAMMFRRLGLSDEEVRDRFGFMLNAFEYGVPPHGGFAFGLDRLLMMMLGTSSIRDVIAFPKMRDASCAMIQTPSSVQESQLHELSIYLEGQAMPEVQKEAISQETIEYVASLSRLELQDSEKAELTQNLMDIIAFADQLSELDTSDVPPLDHILPIQNVFRKDEVQPSYTPEDLLKSAPKAINNCFFVPKTVE